MPVMICWSEKLERSLRGMGAVVDLRRLRRMIVAERKRERKFVIMKERRTWRLGVSHLLYDVDIGENQF